MNIKDLQYFLAVAELEHFGKAAAKCHISQPTLSGQIKKLEEQLGITLFERNNRKVIVTEPAKKIAIHAKRILGEVNSIKEIASNLQNPLSGKFRLGAFPTLAPYIFPNIVIQSKRHMPELRLILIEEKTEKLLEMLDQGTIDAAFLALPVANDFLVTHTLFEDEFYLAVPSRHELTQYQYADQSILKEHSVLLLEEGHCLRNQSLEACNLYNIEEEQDFKATGLETLRQMVKAGTGITFIPQIAIKKNDAGIDYIPFKQPAPKRTIGLVWRKTTARKRVMDKLIEMELDFEV